MKNKFDSGIEISNSVLNSSTPAKIKRYSNLQNKIVKKAVSSENIVYRYRPGVNSNIIGDLDV